jgi:hypothetical protein
MKDLNQLAPTFIEAIKQDRLFQIALVVAVLFIVAAVRQISQGTGPVTVSVQPSQPSPATTQAPAVTQPQQAPAGSLFAPQPQATKVPPAIKEVKPGQSLEALDASGSKKPDDNFARAKKGEEPKKVEVVN